MEQSFLQPAATATPALDGAIRHQFGWVSAAVLALIVSFWASAICYWQTSLTLGLFLGPLILATIYSPCLVLADKQARARLSVLAALIGGSTIVWFCVPGHRVITWQQDLDCALVLGAWICVVSGGSLVLAEAGFAPNLAATVTIVVSFVWLSWPIWLSALLPSHERTVGWLCWAHPIMAMNSVVRQLGLWGSPMGGSDLAYRYLTNLNQDVAYPHSQSIWPCVAIHGLFGISLVSVGLMLGWFRQDRSGRG